MNMSLCYSTPALLTVSGGILHWAHLSFSLAALFLLLLATYILTAGSGRKRWIESLLRFVPRLHGPKNALEARSETSRWPWRQSLARLTSRIRHIPRGEGGGYWGSVAFCAVLGSLMAYGLTRVPNYPVYEYHNVKVLEQVAPNKWLLEREDGKTLWNGCPDFPNADVIWAGYVMEKFRYEDQGKCKSILRSDLGVWWKRDSRGNVEVIK
jgi:hypothetical protein